jgi:phage FluMu gp28-like protein
VSLRAVLKCLERKRTWVLLSAGERQSRLLMDKVREHLRAIGVVEQFIESSFMEGTSTKQLEVKFPNGSVIYGLPANPDTARGYSAFVTLDEFALNEDQNEIYAALYPSITRGYGIEIVSTAKGKQGKFYDLCKKAGLVDGEEKDPAAPWSPHRVDIYEAAGQGLADSVPDPGSVHEKFLAMVSPGFIERGIRATPRMLRFVGALRAGVDFEDEWMQEFCCQFISTAENFFPPELLKAATSPEARVNLTMGLIAREPGEFFLGIDIGRHHDRTVFWLDRVTRVAAPAPDAPAKRVSIARLVRTAEKMPFHEQLQIARELLSFQAGEGRVASPLIRRCCIDATGMGAPLAEQLQREFGAARVEGVTFTALVKEDMAHRTKRKMEAGEVLLPEAPEVHRAFAAIKKVVLPSGAIRFDAERTEAGHADQFWAKALADLAAEQPRLEVECFPSRRRTAAATMAGAF